MSKKDHILSAIIGGLVGVGLVGVGAAVATGGSGVAVAGKIMGVGVGGGLAANSFNSNSGKFKPWSAVQGATMSLAVIFGATSYNLNNELDDVYANNTVIPNTEIASDLRPSYENVLAPTAR